MIIDCQTCVARDLACGDCVVGVLLASSPPSPASREHPVRSAGPARAVGPTVDLDEDERDALGSLAAAGLIPPLRLVRSVPTGEYGPDRNIA